MAPYWLMFALPVMGALSPISLTSRLRLLAFIIFSFVIVVFVGFRYEVGGDWPNYLAKYTHALDGGFSHIFSERSIGYAFINWISVGLGWGIYGVNTMCAAIFTVGLSTFCWRQPLSWLAWVVSVPYLIIVVAMGYTAQSIAVGFVLLALCWLEKKRYLICIATLLFATLFHKSVIAILPIILVYPIFTFITKTSNKKKLRKTLVWAVPGIVVGAFLLLRYFGSDVFNLVNYYIYRGQWVSGGAYYRLMLSLIPAILLLSYYREFRESFSTELHWVLFAIIIVAFVGLASLSTTMVDRLSIYLMPLQIYVWTRLPLVFENRSVKSLMIFGIVAYHALVLGLWLNYAHHSYSWVPYSSALFN